MRISIEQIDVITDTLRSSISDASVYLFGSRIDDSKRGGDIDIFLLTEQVVELRDKIRLLSQLERKGIARKVDLVISSPGHPNEKIYREVMDKGIRLC